jgi:hypothetical protein
MGFLLWMCLAFRQLYVQHIKHVTANYSFCTIHKLSVSIRFAKQITLVSYTLCYNGSLVTWTVVSLTTAKFKPLIFCMTGFTLSYTANMFILTTLHDFYLSPPQFCYNNRIQREGWKPCANRGPACTLENFQWYGEPLNWTRSVESYSLGVDPTKNVACNTSSIVVWRHRVRHAFLCCVCTGHYPATGLHVAIY